MISSIWHTHFIEEYVYSISQETCALTGKHKEVSICKCGKNTICYNCGYGQGSNPCDCNKGVIVTREILYG